MIPPQGKYNFCCTALFFSDFEHARMTRALGLDIFSGHRQSLSQSILASNNFPFQEMVKTGSINVVFQTRRIKWILSDSFASRQLRIDNIHNPDGTLLL